MNEPTNLATPDEAEFQSLGKALVAYARPVEVDGVQGFAVYGADGEVIGFAPQLEEARMALRDQGMELVGVH